MCSALSDALFWFVARAYILAYVLPAFCRFFFFQAEDGIRDKLVTGVQTCALPISPSKAAPPRPRPPSSRAPAAAPAPGPRAAADLLTRLTTLAQELTGAFRPATVVELLARALLELLKPDRLAVVLLDAETNRLAVTYDTDPAPRSTDDPLLQLALRRGPQIGRAHV